MNIPIKTLQCFLTLVETGNFTRAAEQLYLTQPTISKMIQRLEDNLGQQLLIRNNQKVELTQAGVLFQHSAHQMIGQWHRLQEDISNLTGLKTGLLRLGVCPMMSGMIIDLLGPFREKYPGVEVQMQEFGGFGCEQALLNDTLDIAFTALPVTHSEQISSQLLVRYPLLACLPDQHELISQEALTWKDIEPFPFIIYNEDFSLAKLISRLTKADQVKLNIAFRSGQWDFLAAMVEANMGIALLPEPICQRLEPSKLTYKQMQPAMTWDIALMWRNNLPLTPAAKALLELGRKIYPQPEP